MEEEGRGVEEEGRGTEEKWVILLLHMLTHAYGSPRMKNRLTMHIGYDRVHIACAASATEH